MKLAVGVLLLAAVSHAAEVANNNEKVEEKADKRELSEGNAGISPTASSALTSGGVEYADSKNASPDKSPAQQMYATPVPQIAKISDLFTGQNPSYQAAIANHLYSPVSIYQPKLGLPITYEVSAPVPSNLAYSEHRLSLPSPNAIQYNAKSQKLIKPFIGNYQQPQFSIQQSYEQNVAPIQSAQRVTNPLVNQHAQYNPFPELCQLCANRQQLQYIQVQPNQLPAGTTYQQEQQLSPNRNRQQAEQRDLKSQPAPPQVLEKQQVAQQVNKGKQQNALSYARFSINQQPSYEQTQQVQLIQPKQQQYQLSQQQVVQPQPSQYQLQPQPLPQINYQLQHSTQQLSPVQQPAIQSQLQFQSQSQPQIQYQEQPQYLYQQLQEQALNQQSLPLPQPIREQPYQFQLQQFQHPQLVNVEKPEPVLTKQSTPEGPAYFKSTPIIQPNLNHDQSQVQNLGYQNLPAALPTFPPVQYFGKFAHSLFGGYQH